MPDCLTCEHSSALHTDGGYCSTPGCACDELRLPEMAPEVDPPKPGACVHLMGEAAWVVEEMSGVEEKLNDSSEFIKLTACDFEKVVGEKKERYCTYPVHVRPQVISSYHGFVQERWDKLLDGIR